MGEQCACDWQTLVEVHTTEACYDLRDVARWCDESRRARAKIESVERAHDEVVRERNTAVADVERLGEALKDARADADYFQEWADGNGRRLNDAMAEVQRLTRALRLSEAKVGGAKLYVDQVNARSAMLDGALTAYEGIADERDRYRLAWLSARRRAAEEAVLGAEAVEHIAADRDRWQRGHERAEAQLHAGRRVNAELHLELERLRAMLRDD